jgi:hypothetical protein
VGYRVKNNVVVYEVLKNLARDFLKQIQLIFCTNKLSKIRELVLGGLQTPVKKEALGPRFLTVEPRAFWGYGVLGKQIPFNPFNNYSFGLRRIPK